MMTIVRRKKTKKIKVERLSPSNKSASIFKNLPSKYRQIRKTTTTLERPFLYRKLQRQQWCLSLQRNRSTTFSCSFPQRFRKAIHHTLGPTSNNPYSSADTYQSQRLVSTRFRPYRILFCQRKYLTQKCSNPKSTTSKTPWFSIKNPSRQNN